MITSKTCRVTIDLNSISDTNTTTHYSCTKCGKVLDVYFNNCKTYVEKCDCDNKILIISGTYHDPEPPPQIKNTFFDDMNKKFRLK